MFRRRQGASLGLGNAVTRPTVTRPAGRFLFLLALVSATASGEDNATHHPELPAFSERLLRVEAARGPAVYTAIDLLAEAAAFADPAAVDAALAELQDDPKRTPAERAYARATRATAAYGRGDASTAARGLTELGFVWDWSVVGPFDNEGGTGFERDLGPEQDLAAPLDVTKDYPGKERAVRWRAVTERGPAARVWLNAVVEPSTNVCGFLTTFVREAKSAAATRPAASRAISLRFGGMGAHRVYWNGARVFSEPAYRGIDVDRSAVEVDLRPGFNRLTVKLCGKETVAGFVARFATPDGSPLAGLEVRSDAEAAREAAANAAPDATLRANAANAGPLARFTELTRGEKPRPEDLYDFARYLVETQGDDPLTHQARDLAGRAAEAQPTVETLLLAARLAEDRNKRAEWITKAAALPGAPTAELLVAQAELAEQSQSWQEALPLYERAFRLDPDNFDALQGRLRFYDHAGLKRTSLALVAEAVNRRPRSPRLLSLYAGRLAQLNQESEALAVGARLGLSAATTRGLGASASLAIARHELDRALYWTERLATTGAPNQALREAAQRYERLGRPDLAAPLYTRLLALSPEDTGAMKALADLQADAGNRPEQLALLRRILELKPQTQNVRDYLSHLEPEVPRPDEAFAWTSEKFLPLATGPGARGNSEQMLVDLTVSTVFESGLSSSFRQVVFQPLTDAAAEEARTYGFTFEGDRQRVTLRGARVYRPDGTVDESISTSQGAVGDPSIATYTSQRAYYVEFPKLHAGDIVELRYRIDDVARQNDYGDYFGEVITLQAPVPVAHAEYILISPEARKLRSEVIGLEGVEHEVSTKDGQRTERFVANNLPPVLAEPSMPPWGELLGRVHVSSYGSWGDLGAWYWGLARDQFDVDAETRKLAREIAGDATTDEQRVARVYDWVTRNTRYVGLEFGIEGHKPRRSVQTIARGWGDCKDKATVLVTLLKELGVESTLVALRTARLGDFRSELASLAPFDHAIVYVPKLDLYLDGTAELTGTRELPTGDLGATGLLINQGDAVLVKLPEASPAREAFERRVTATLAADGSAQIAAALEVRGSIAPGWRNRYHAEGSRRERVARDLGEQLAGFALAEGEDALATSDLTNVEAPVSMKMRGSVPQLARREGPLLSAPLGSDVNFTGRFATLSTRKLDVWLPVFGTRAETFEVELPKGAHVESLPSDVSLETPFGTYRFDVEREGDRIVAKSTITLTARRVAPKDYAAWRDFCLKVDESQRARLVLRPEGAS